jgi:hypothetical protein
MAIKLLKKVSLKFFPESAKPALQLAELMKDQTLRGMSVAVRSTGGFDAAKNDPDSGRGGGAAIAGSPVHPHAAGDAMELSEVMFANKLKNELRKIWAELIPLVREAAHRQHGLFRGGRPQLDRDPAPEENPDGPVLQEP